MFTEEEAEKLREKRKRVAVENLREIKDVFDENGIKFWLDSGTLLGAVRDGKIIEWDGDVDLGTWHRDASKIISTFAEFKRRGFDAILNRKQAAMSIIRSDCSINFGLYRERDNYAWNQWTRMRKTAVEKILNRGVNILSVRAYAKQEGTFNRKIKHLSSLLPLTLKKLVANTAWLLLHNLGYTIPVVIPKHYFEKLSTIQFYGIEFNIPSDAERYLEYRYGSNWKIPIRNWVPYEDDAAIAPNWDVLHFKI